MAHQDPRRSPPPTGCRPPPLLPVTLAALLLFQACATPSQPPGPSPVAPEPGLAQLAGFYRRLARIYREDLGDAVKAEALLRKAGTLAPLPAPAEPPPPPAAPAPAPPTTTPEPPPPSASVRPAPAPAAEPPPPAAAPPQATEGPKPHAPATAPPPPAPPTTTPEPPPATASVRPAPPTPTQPPPPAAAPTQATEGQEPHAPPPAPPTTTPEPPPPSASVRPAPAEPPPPAGPPVALPGPRPPSAPSPLAPQARGLLLFLDGSPTSGRVLPRITSARDLLFPGVPVLAVLTGELPPQLPAGEKRTIPLMRDPDGGQASSYGITAYPSFLVLDDGGRVLLRVEGASLEGFLP